MKMPVNDVKIRRERMRSVIDVDSDEMLALAEDIKAIGLIHPITVDKEGYLIAGERRLMAHRIAGIELIDVTVSEADAVQIELSENTQRLELPWPDRARGEVRLWNYMLKKDPDWSLKQHAHMFHRTTDKIRTFLRLGRALETRPHLEGAATMAEATRLLTEEETREAHGDYRTDLAEVHVPEWAKDRYVLGDAFEGLRQLAASQPQQRGVASHLAFVDPPQWEEEFGENYSRIVALLPHCMMPNSFALFWFPMERYSEVFSILSNSSFSVSPTPSIWVKHQLTATPKPDSLLGTAFAPFFVARLGRPRLGRPGRGNVFSYPEQYPLIASHEKPYTLCAEICKTFLFPGSRVIIPFLGSGNMLRAATAAGHMAFGWDVNPDYKARFLKRAEEDRRRWDPPR